MLDSLTGVFDRDYYQQLMDMLEQDQRFPISLILVDVNYLQKITEEQGRPAGDVLLQMVAKLIRSCFRSEDAVIRVGEDEFLVVLSQTPPEVAHKLVERLRRTITAHNLKPGAVQISVSIGVGVADEKLSINGAYQFANDAVSVEKNGPLS